MFKYTANEMLFFYLEQALWIIVSQDLFKTFFHDQETKSLKKN